MVNLWSHFRCTVQENLDIADFIIQRDWIAMHIITTFSFTNCSSEIQAIFKACVLYSCKACAQILHTPKLTIKQLLDSLKYSNNAVRLIKPS